MSTIACLEVPTTREDNSSMDPLERSNEVDVDPESNETEKRKYSREEVEQILTERQEVDMTDEDMDPLEWTFRKLVPIPAHFYWDVVVDEKERAHIPTKIKVWHKTIASLGAVQQFADRWIARPVASGLGVTSSRFQYVTDNMTQEDWKESKRIVTERKEKEKPVKDGEHSED